MRRGGSPTSCRCGARTACRPRYRCSSPNPTSRPSIRKTTWTCGADCGWPTMSARFSPAAANLFAATGDITDGVGHRLVTAYPVLRPDGNWALLVVNKDQENGHQVAVRFDDTVRQRSGGFAGPVSAIVFGKAEYQWRPDLDGGTADPDGPPAAATVNSGPNTTFTLPPASITVLRGRVAMRARQDPLRK